MNAVPRISRTVTVRLVGGLGNQMFQYAAALGLALRQDRRLLLDVSAFATYKSWPYQLDRLNVPQDLCQAALLRGRASTKLLDRALRRLRRLSAFGGSIYREPFFHFDPAVFELAGEAIFLDGYFQSPQYFVGAEDFLRVHFQPKAALSNTAVGWAARIAASPCSVSLHVRRGDYLTAVASAVHVALGRDYYNRAVALMLDLVGPEAEFFLFSDDPDFIADAFAGLPNAHVVRSDPAASWEDMFLMARCRHNIIANSSYSWWGAWLNPRHDKRVIAPAHWFAPVKLASCNVLDLYPDDWILLK